MSNKRTLKGKFVDKPEDGRFSYRNTRKAITSILLQISKDSDGGMGSKERLFAKIWDFDVTKEGEFTCSAKLNKDFGSGIDAGIEEENAVDEILDQIEKRFNIGGHTYTEEEKDEIKKLASKGVLSIGYIMGFKDEDSK